MVRRNGFRLLVTLSMLAAAVPAWGIAAAQEAQPTVEPHATAVLAAAAPATKDERPYLGIRLEDTAQGVVVRQVLVASPAAMGGVQIDDMLQKVNSTSVANVTEAAKVLDALKTGDAVTLDVMRAGKAMSLNATVGSIISSALTGLPSDMPFDAMGYNSAEHSWQIFNIGTEGELYKAGLHMNDQIMQLNGKAYDPADLRTFIHDLKDSDTVKVSITRDGKAQDISVPATALKALDLFGYTDQGILLDVISGAQNPAPSTNLLSLPTNEPFDAFGYDSANKAWQVFGLVENSDLYTAGLRMGDHITQFDGKAYDPAALQSYRQALADNAMVKITVDRAGKNQDISVNAGALNGLDLFHNAQGGMLFGLPISGEYGAWLGIDALRLNAQIAKEHQLDLNTGMLITNVTADSPAAKAGLQANDVITGLGTTKLDANTTWQSILAAHKPGEQVTLDVLRAGKDMQIQATLGAPAISGDVPYLMPAF
jgi:S1-C subfamily serine protease